jgi:hypothetical protein
MGECTRLQENPMQRVLIVVLLLLVCAAPTLALASSAHAGKPQCPLGDEVTAGEVDPGKAAPHAAADSATLAPGRSDAQGLAPRSRSRWQSLLPGMLK